VIFRDEKLRRFYGKKNISKKKRPVFQRQLPREGLDEILHGGLPAGRITLIGGGPGTGKTVLGLEFLYRRALSGDPGIFLSFEETAESIRRNMLSFGWDLASLEKAEKLFLIEGQVDPEWSFQVILISRDCWRLSKARPEK
jgi:archaellum biogenesis ATPase FlaH